MVQPVAHASELIAPTRRFTLTAAGLRHLAESEGINAERLLHERPVSEQARRLFLGRIDALAALYRICCASWPISPFRSRSAATGLCRSISVCGWRTVARSRFVRLGRINERRSLARRLARLCDGPAFAAVLLLVPDETRLRDTARRLRSSCHNPASSRLSRTQLKAGPDSLGFGAYALGRSRRSACARRWALPGPTRTWPTERTLVRVSPPAEEML